MTTRPPTYTPPPAPLPTPPVPSPPPPPAPLTVGDRFRHLAGWMGCWALGGLVTYLGFRAGPVGWGWLSGGASCLTMALGGLLGVGGLLLLLPLWHEWHAAQLWRDHQTALAYDQDRREKVLLLGQLAYYDHVFHRGVGHDPDYKMTHMGKPVVQSVTTPPASAPARARVADVESWLTDRMDAVDRTMRRAFGEDDLDEEAPDDVAEEPPTERPTTRLPVLARFRAPTPPPRVAYTADLRLVVRTMYETGGVADLLKDKTLPRKQWDAACKALAAAGVFTKDKGGAWRLVPRYRYYGQDYGLTALHAKVQTALQAGM